MKSTNIDTGYVCYCMRLAEDDLREWYSEHPDASFHDLCEQTGVATQCSACEFEVRSLFDDWRAEKGLSTEIDTKDRREKVSSTLFHARWLRQFRRTKPNYRNGLFALRRDGLESRFVTSNLALPESGYNPNGPYVKFTVTYISGDGLTKITTKPLYLENNSSREYRLEELFPTVGGDVVGAVYIDFHDLSMTSSLRAYGVMHQEQDGLLKARCHYHDKYARFRDPGFFQTSWPFAPEKECWAAISNCMEVPFESRVALKTDSGEVESRINLGAYESRWLQISQLLGGYHCDKDPALLYFDNPQHVMVWFFWRHVPTGAWVGQHH